MVECLDFHHRSAFLPLHDLIYLLLDDLLFTTVKLKAFHDYVSLISIFAVDESDRR